MKMQFDFAVRYSGSVDLVKFFGAVGQWEKECFHEFSPSDWGYDDDDSLSGRVAAFVAMRLDELVDDYMGAAAGIKQDVWSGDRDWRNFPEVSDADAEALATRYPWMWPEDDERHVGPADPNQAALQFP